MHLPPTVSFHLPQIQRSLLPEKQVTISTRKRRLVDLTLSSSDNESDDVPIDRNKRRILVRPTANLKGRTGTTASIVDENDSDTQD